MSVEQVTLHLNKAIMVLVKIMKTTSCPLFQLLNKDISLQTSSSRKIIVSNDFIAVYTHIVTLKIIRLNAYLTD